MLPNLPGLSLLQVRQTKQDHTVTNGYKCQAIYHASLTFCLLGQTYIQVLQMYRPHSAGCTGAVVVQTALAQASAADRRSFLQPYNHAFTLAAAAPLNTALRI